MLYVNNISFHFNDFHQLPLQHKIPLRQSIVKVAFNFNRPEGLKLVMALPVL